MRPQGKGVYEECALGLEFMVVKPHPVAMIQAPSGVYVLLTKNVPKIIFGEWAIWTVLSFFQAWLLQKWRCVHWQTFNLALFATICQIAKLIPVIWYVRFSMHSVALYRSCMRQSVHACNRLTDSIIASSMDLIKDRMWVWSLVSFLTTVRNCFNWIDN